MARKFDIPEFYKSPIISQVKRARQLLDPKKRDLQPSVLDFGPVRFSLARHFGFALAWRMPLKLRIRPWKPIRIGACFS